MTVLTIFLAFLFLLPARLVVSGVGAIGRPAILLGIAACGWWVLTRMAPDPAVAGRHPLRRALLFWGLVMLVAYALGFSRGLPGVEARASDRTMLNTLGLFGVAFVAMDGCRTRARLDDLLQRLTYAAGALSAIGALQFWFNYNLAQRITLPGLVYNREIGEISTRGVDLSRVMGTASHPIEFGVVLGMILPIAMHFALFAGTRSERQWRWALVALIATGSLLSISRSAVIAVGVGIIVVAFSWRSQLRFRLLGATAVFLVVFRFIVPGLLGTLRSLFENTANDPSIEGRTSDYDVVFSFVSTRPWFGRGPGTFLPDEYVVLDNQILGTLVTTGVVGLAALVVLFFTAWRLARVVLRSPARPEVDRHLGLALSATIAAGFATSFTFDSLGFPIYAGTLFVAFGAAGALWRLRPDSWIDRNVSRDDLAVLRPAQARAAAL